MGVGAGWYYDSLDGDVVHQNLAESLANAAFSYYHGPYKTEALAVAHAGVAGPSGVANEPVGQQLANVTTGSFLGILEGRGLWVRIAEVAIGGTLVIVGVSKLLGTGQAAETVAKAAIIK